LLAESAHIITPNTTSREELLKHAGVIDAVIVRDQLPSDFFDHAPNLKAAVRHGTGLDMIPMNQAVVLSIPVANGTGTNAASEAEHVMLVTLMLMRKDINIDTDFRKNDWHISRKHANTGKELRGRTLGVVGIGHVGRTVAEAANSLGMRVLGSSSQSTAR